MINNIPAGSIPNLLSLLSQTGKAGPSLAGLIVQAKVIDITQDGSALLRLIASSGMKGNIQGTTIKATADVPLTKGQTVFLEILGSKDNIQLKFVGKPIDPAGPLKQNPQTKLLDMLVQLSGSKLSSTESKQLLIMLRSLPQNVKNAFPEFKALENILQNTTRPNAAPSAANSARSLTTLMASSDKPLSINPGTVVKAEVVDVTGKGNAVLRLIASDSSNSNIPGATIKAALSVPVAKGQHIFLETIGGTSNIKMRSDSSNSNIPGATTKANLSVPVAKGQVMFPETPGGTSNIKMRIVEGFPNPSEATLQTVPIKLLNMFSQISDARLGNSEFKFIYNMLKSLPQSVKAEIPEFQNLEKLLLDIKQLDGKMLKAFVESSGVAYETRMKVSVLNDPGSMLQNLMALQAEGDLKALLLNLRKLLKNQSVVNTLKQAGFKMTELSSTIDNFIRNIEFFQFTSRLNDMFCTFLPVMWDDLKDSEFIFKKDKRNRKSHYTCGINLNLESLGKLSISVTISDKVFYISFHAEESEIANLLRSQKHVLEERFASEGLKLKAVNIDQKKIVFGETQRQEINVKA